MDVLLGLYGGGLIGAAVLWAQSSDRATAFFGRIFDIVAKPIHSAAEKLHSRRG